MLLAQEPGLVGIRFQSPSDVAHFLQFVSVYKETYTHGLCRWRTWSSSRANGRRGCYGGGHGRAQGCVWIKRSRTNIGADHTMDIRPVLLRIILPHSPKRQRRGL